MNWIDAILQGTLLGGQYALYAAGLSLIFGVMRLVNIAHGDFYYFGGLYRSSLRRYSRATPLVKYDCCLSRYVCYRLLDAKAGIK